jgi:hypothetical protein
MSNPPAVPQALLSLLLSPDARESVCGDLLEEYRESRAPVLGKRRADVWYWRQVLGIWLRTYWWVVVPLILVLVVHDIFNTFRAPSGASYLDGLPLLARVPLSPVVAVAFFVMAGAYGSRRTKEFNGGLVAALGTFVLLWLFMVIWWNATFYPFAQVQQSNPYWIQAWQWSTARAHTPNESFIDWIFWDNVGALFFGGLALSIASIICGGIGSGLGLIAPCRRLTD